MRVAFLSDIHANLPALEAALTVVERLGAERTVVAGDLIGDGPFPAEVLELLRQRGAECIAGNVDRVVVELAMGERKLVRLVKRGKGQRSNRAWTALQLRNAPYALGWLDRLPGSLTLPVSGQQVLVVHGSPLGDTDYIYPSLTSDALTTKLAPLRGPRPHVLVSGHSHIPFASEVDEVVVVNCGSVGRPADGDPRGSLALVEIERGRTPRTRLIRFTYPLDRLLAAITDRGVPGIDPEEYSLGIKR